MNDKDYLRKGFPEWTKNPGDASLENPGGVRTDAEPRVQKLIHELKTKRIEMEEQNEALRRLRKELDAAKRRCSELYEMAPNAYFTLDQQGLIQEVNLTGADLLGFEKGFLINTSFSRFVVPEFERAFDLHRRKVMDSGSWQACELKLTSKGGTQFFAELQSIAVRDDRGPVKQLRTALTDITGRRMAEQALKESEAQKKAILDGITTNIAFVNENMEIQWANRAAAGSVNLSPERLIGRKCHEFWADSVIVCDGCPAKRAFRSRRTEENIMRTPDGRVWDTRAEPVFDDGGRLIGVVEISQDITKKSLAEEALRASENRYRVLFNSGNDAVFVHQPTADGTPAKFIEVNSVACQRYGYTRAELLNLTPAELSDPERKHETASRIRKLFAEKHILFETIQVAKDGTRIPAEIHSHLFDFHGKPTVLSIARDMTEHRRASEHIHTLSRQLMKAQESERQMIARELHDRVAQDLSTLKIGIDTLLDNQPNVPIEVHQRASNLAGMIRGTIASVRELAYDLRPPGLDQFGLVQIISQYCDDFAQMTGIMVDFQYAGMDRLDLDFDTKINLYRLIQEGLNNVRKHAEAGRVTARLIASSPNIILRIEDDGKGFNVKERMATMDHEKRMGLRSMEERVGLLGGTMRIGSRPSKGTRIFIEVPY